MVDPPPYSEGAGTPRWVKVSGIIAIVVVLLVVVMLLIGGNHGPGRHTGPGDGGGHTPPSGVPGHDLPQP